MQLYFSGQGLEVTPALETFTTQKLQPLKKRYPNIISIHVIFRVEHIRQIATATVEASGIEVHATAESEDMYIAIVELVNKLMSQLNKHKEKMADHHK